MDSRLALQMYSDSDKVRKFIAEYADIDPKEVTDEADLTDDLGLDWLDQLELMVLIEDEFVGIDFSPTPQPRRASSPLGRLNFGEASN